MKTQTINENLQINGLGVSVLVVDGKELEQLPKGTELNRVFKAVAVSEVAQGRFMVKVIIPNKDGVLYVTEMSEEVVSQIVEGFSIEEKLNVLSSINEMKIQTMTDVEDVEELTPFEYSSIEKYIEEGKEMYAVYTIKVSELYGEIVSNEKDEKIFKTLRGAFNNATKSSKPFTYSFNGFM